LAVDLLAGSQAGGYGMTALIGPVGRLVALVSRWEELQEKLGPVGPLLAASQMHPWVWDAASHLWDDGHVPQAVSTAASTIFDSYLPTKLGIVPGTFSVEKMIADAFDENDPQLLIPGFVKGNQNWTNAYQGARNLGLACAKMVRNLGTHNVTNPGPQEVALEELAMLSRFARLIDSSNKTP
jgi:hypothetical protein